MTSQIVTLSNVYVLPNMLVPGSRPGPQRLCEVYVYWSCRGYKLGATRRGNLCLHPDPKSTTTWLYSRPLRVKW